MPVTEDSRVKKLITLAGVCDYKSRFSTTSDIEQWKKDGVKYVMNGRTKQQMPHFYQFYEDFIANEKRLTIKRAVEKLLIPHCIIHGDGDTSVTIEEGKNLHKWNPKSEFRNIENANHVFGAKHPWDTEDLPEHLQEVITITIGFLKTT